MAFVADKEVAKQRLDAAMQTLETGVSTLTNSDNWKNHLNFQSRFHKYSFGNTLLIYSQNPNASRVAGFHTWNSMGRHVRKGERGIVILAPRFAKVKKQDNNGDEHEEIILVGFTTATVFDVSQTDGKELPEIVGRLTGNTIPQELLTKLATFSSTRDVPCPVTYENITDGSLGYYIPTQHRIVLKSDMAIDDTIHALVHEIAHSLLHSDMKTRQELTRTDRELEAESVAYIVLQVLGYDVGSFSFGYLASWAESVGADFAKEMKKIGERVQKAAKTILDALNVKEDAATEEAASA